MDLRADATIEVEVSSVEQFGLLVAFEGREGVVLVTNLYWDCVGAQKRMFEDFRPGSRLQVKVLLVTPRQFSASLKHTHPEADPWRDPQLYAIGSRHHGFVRLIFDSGGALVQLANGADVILERLRPQTRLNDDAEVVVSAVDVATQRIRGELL